MRKYSAGSMPVSELLRPALPRTARPEPAATGATTRTPGRAWICAATARHWSMDFSRCRGGCTMAPSMAGVWAAGSALAADLGQVLVGPASGPPRSCRVTCWAGSNWTWAWALSTRRMKLACRPDSSADMKTITATPMATPVMMNRVCKRPSRRKRSATIHSEGSQVGNIGAPPAQGAGAAGAAEPAAARTRAPAATAAVAGSTRSPAARPSSTSAHPPLRRPRRSGRRSARPACRPSTDQPGLALHGHQLGVVEFDPQLAGLHRLALGHRHPPHGGSDLGAEVHPVGRFDPAAGHHGLHKIARHHRQHLDLRPLPPAPGAGGQRQVPAASARPTRAATHHGPRQRRAGTCSVLFLRFQLAAITVGSGRRCATGAGRCQVPRARASGRSSRPGRSAARERLCSGVKTRGQPGSRYTPPAASSNCNIGWPTTSRSRRQGLCWHGGVKALGPSACWRRTAAAAQKPTTLPGESGIIATILRVAAGAALALDQERQGLARRAARAESASVRRRTAQ